LIIECPPEVSLQAVSEQMGWTPPWAPGLVLRADGDEMAYYQKA
jgi:DNA polymerase